MLKVGLLGTGNMGGVHAEVYKLLSLSQNVKLCGVFDINTERATNCGKAHMAKVYSSAEEMINDKELDVIDICVPTYLHAKYAELAIKAKKNVFIEKPVVIDLNQGKRLVELKNEYGVEIMVGQCVRLWPSYVYLKEIYDTKKYGNLKRLSLRRISTRPTWGWEDWYGDEEKSGSAIFDLHIHDIDFARYLLGEPEKLRCFGNKNYTKTILSASGCLVEIENGWDFPSSYPFTTGYRADFEHASLVLKNGEVDIYEDSGRFLQVDPDNDYDDERLGEKIASLAGYYYELKYFYDCLMNNKKVEIASIEEALASVALIYKEIEGMEF